MKNIDTNNTKKYNSTLDFLKCLACMAVVFMHTNAGSIVDSVLTCLCRFAVPLFFMVSGYYCYNRDIQKVRQKLPYKIMRIVKMSLIATIIYFLWDWIFSNLLLENQIIDIFSYIKGMVNIRSMVEFFIFNKTIWGGTLWFLFALIYCYGIMYIINRFDLYKISYTLAIVILVFHIISRGIIQHYGLIDEEINVYLYRNWLFMGLPFFLIGNFLCRYNEAICKKISNKKLYWIIMLGTMFSCIERFIVPLEIYFGTTFAVLAMYIIAMKNPDMLKCKIIVAIGKKYSLFIYIMHSLVNNVLITILDKKNIVLPKIVLEMNPIIIFCLTLFMAYIFYFAMENIKKFYDKNRKEK